MTGLISYFQHKQPLNTSACKVKYFLTLPQKNVKSVKLEILHSLRDLYKNSTEQMIGLKISLVAYVLVYFCQTCNNLVQ